MPKRVSRLLIDEGYFPFEDDDGSTVIGDLGGCPLSLEEAQTLLDLVSQYMANNTAATILERQKRYYANRGTYEQIYGEPVPEEYRRTVQTVIIKPQKFTYIYLMLDRGTLYYKIGHSQSLAFREKTLQAEKPTIELLGYMKGTIQDEKDLHERYQAKRTRGEWFALSLEDVRTILQEFKRKNTEDANE